MVKGKLSMGIGAILIIVAVLMMLNILPSRLATVEYESNVPEGDFYINGELATMTSKHTVTDPKLNFKFIATANGDQVVKVYVIPYKGGTMTNFVETSLPAGGISLTETRTDIEWTGSATLTGPGTYVLKGRVSHTTGSIQLMSVEGAWTGSEGTFTGQPTFESMQLSVSSLVLLIAGVALVGVGVYWERES